MRNKCTVKDCLKFVFGNGNCAMHYSRKRRYGSVHKTIHASPGTGYITPHGYKSIYKNGRRRYEHQIVMENSIGRKLNKGEVVHHINHDTLDNRIENLELLQNGLHTKLHMTTTFRNNTHKQCTKCFVTKPRSQFYVQKHNKPLGDNHTCFCKSCHDTYTKKYR